MSLVCMPTQTKTAKAMQRTKWNAIVSNSAAKRALHSVLMTGVLLSFFLFCLPLIMLICVQCIGSKKWCVSDSQKVIQQGCRNLAEAIVRAGCEDSVSALPSLLSLDSVCERLHCGSVTGPNAQCQGSWCSPAPPVRSPVLRCCGCCGTLQPQTISPRA